MVVSPLDEVDDARLLAIASERFAHYAPENVITEQEIDERLGITEDDLRGYEDVDFD